MLAQQLAGHYRTVWVPEYAREYIDRLNRPYEENDILEIAKGQLEHEEHLAGKAHELLFCDTELTVTKIWSEVKYGRCHPWILEQIGSHPYPLYLLCDIDIPWQADPQREHPHLRKYLLDLYEQELAGRGVNFRIISGLGESRLQSAVREVERYLSGNRKNY
jgi:nicotinamide riboside kinase